MKKSMIVISTILLIVCLAYLDNVYLDGGNHYHWQNMKKTFN